MAEEICFQEWKKEIAVVISEWEHHLEAQLQHGDLEENEISSTRKSIENTDRDVDYVKEAHDGSTGSEVVSSESEGNLDDFDHVGDYCDVFDRETIGIEEVDNEENMKDSGGQSIRKGIRAYEDHEVVKILANSISKMPSETLSLQAEGEFQNELQIPGGHLSLAWKRRFSIIVDVAKALEFLRLGCDPPVVHGDIKPSNVLLDFDFGAKRIQMEGEFGVNLFSPDLGRSQEMWKSQELFGNLTSDTPAIGIPVEACQDVDFALVLQVSFSSENSRVNFFNANTTSESDVKVENGKGKEASGVDIGGDDWDCKFLPYDDEPVIEPSLPLKFTFGTKEQALVEK
ncbi:hypothetical protein GH714_022009 [Hevea brasiliensis]|uniref:Protein kinase domain-containing protein n=1 Tax=Hevea brasiliensis TaxID=3981 RepID=A0A6A6KW54_HEVBR|nr:hypothetical protein GH714_022009 [Hevea brasiliensis]